MGLASDSLWFPDYLTLEASIPEYLRCQVQGRRGPQQVPLVGEVGSYDERHEKTQVKGWDLTRRVEQACLRAEFGP